MEPEPPRSRKQETEDEDLDFFRTHRLARGGVGFSLCRPIFRRDPTRQRQAAIGDRQIFGGPRIQRRQTNQIRRERLVVDVRQPGGKEIDLHINPVSGQIIKKE
jgi:hypothetical protein